MINPYRSSCDDVPGVYDRSLLFRVMRAFLFLAVVYAVVLAFGAWASYTQSIGYQTADSPLEELWRFVAGWQPPRPTQ
jgi:hypothetical protein